VKTGGRLQELANRGRALARPPQNRSGGDWWKIGNADGDRAEVFIYGYIGDDWAEEDVTAASFTKALRGITASAIDLRVNSPGGAVFDGIAIYTALLDHPATVDVSVDGVAASAASFVSMAGDSIAMQKPAKMMIHDASGIVLGNAADMQEMADLLNELSDTIAGIYADRAGGSVATWRAAMKAETWYSAAAAVEAGLADRVANDTTQSAPEDRRRSQTARARARVHGVKG
jgi:ATP-dependent protease ClpP protease subunit